MLIQLTCDVPVWQKHGLRKGAVMEVSGDVREDRSCWARWPNCLEMGEWLLDGEWFELLPKGGAAPGPVGGMA